jgi:Mg2+-importing ATPase
LTAVLPKSSLDSRRHKIAAIRVAPAVVAAAGIDAEHAFATLNTRPAGLSDTEVSARLEQYGRNVLARELRPGFARLLWRAIINPLVILLATLATISFATGDVRAGLMMVAMIVLSVGLKLFQEAKADNAAAKLKAMISVRAAVMRSGTLQDIAIAQLVPS